MPPGATFLQGKCPAGMGKIPARDSPFFAAGEYSFDIGEALRIMEQNTGEG